MTQYTKGEWALYQHRSNHVSICVKTDSLVACEIATLNTLLNYDTVVTNGCLITTAVNGCQAVNPDNPMAVADSIKEMHEALKRIAQCTGAFSLDRLKGITEAENRIEDMTALANEALNKVEGGAK